MIIIILGLEEPPRESPRVFVPQMKVNALHRQEAAASCLLDRGRGAGRELGGGLIPKSDTPPPHPCPGGGRYVVQLLIVAQSGMANVLKKKKNPEMNATDGTTDWSVVQLM